MSSVCSGNRDDHTPTEIDLQSPLQLDMKDVQPRLTALLNCMVNDGAIIAATAK